jgi:hypothetical protein
VRHGARLAREEEDERAAGGGLIEEKLLSLLYFPFLTHLAYQAAWSTRDRPSEASS